MIFCKYTKNATQIKSININGHAEFSEHGSDIVCSAVSMICYTIGNALLNDDESFNLQITENEFRFEDNLESVVSKLLLNTLLDGLLMVEDQYEDYINIKEV